MNFKTIGFNGALVATVVFGSIMATLPAEAITVTAPSLSPGDFLSISGSAKFGQVNENYVFNFFDGSNQYSTNVGRGRIGAGTTYEVFGEFDTLLTLKDLTLEQTSATTWKLASSPVDNFITGLLDNRVFNLTNFNLKQNQDLTFTAQILGHFLPPGLEGIGTLTTQQAVLNFNGTTYSLDITAVPTPALLPGLIGMSVAAVRKKRKGENAETAEKATANA